MCSIYFNFYERFYDRVLNRTQYFFLIINNFGILFKFLRISEFSSEKIVNYLGNPTLPYEGSEYFYQDRCYRYRKPALSACAFVIEIPVTP